VLTVSKDATDALSVSRILTFLKNQDLEDINKFSERIYCVVYNGKELKYDTLYNMMKRR
jgi:hypothetical protein